MTHELTMREMVEAIPELHLEGMVYDYALPQTWVDDVYKKTGTYPMGFVWAYGPKSVWGDAYPVTEEAKELLARYQEMTR